MLKLYQFQKEIRLEKKKKTYRQNHEKEKTTRKDKQQPT